MMETVEFNIYSINKEKEQIKFAKSVSVGVEIDTQNVSIRVKGCEEGKLTIKDITIDDISFEEASTKINKLSVEESAILIFCKFMGESYLLECFSQLEDEEEFDSEAFLKVLVYDFVKEMKE